MNRKKKRLKLGKLILFIVSIVIITFGVIFGIKKIFGNSNMIIKKSYDKYLASENNVVSIYEYSKNEDGTEVLNKSEDITRVTKISTKNDKFTYEEKEYTLINYNDKEYYVLTNELVDNNRDVVLEKSRFVRTSVTVYKNEVDSKIESFIKKGNELEILDYDKLLDNGNVNMYKIKKDDISGWVYAKYLVNDKDSALANYNENSVYDTHKDRKYGSRELYGGKASTLDYYPYERVSFENNKLLETAKSMYLNAGSNVINNIDSYLDIAKNYGVNMIVVDIKDGALAYSSEVAKEYSMTAYNTAINSNEKYKSAIDKIKEAGIYVVGRIVVFNDVHYGKDHPEDCITSSASSRLWPSAYSRGAWEYNVELAKEAIRTMGFNEIQFDYVRFPEDAYNMSVKGNTDFKNKYDEEKAEAVQNFLFYAVDQIHKEGAYLSVDVFGECSSEYVTAYGQYWPAISNIVDAISSMPYTDHFGRNNDTWSNPYKTVYNWAVGAAKRQTEIPTPAIARTWITAYDTPYWNPKVIYDASKISDQAKALVDAGLKGGFITWNSASSLSKYQQIKSAFNKDY
ncbi:MAG: putative glycoside hydrolase [Bacilli bacterium]|nr:putative glycoside hydrolase [Bacilli bacterium]